MDLSDFYDIIDMKNVKIGDTIGKLKLTVLTDIINENNCKKYTATYKGEKKALLTNQYVFSFKENIQLLDLHEFTYQKDKKIDKAMAYEINQFIKYL